MSSGALANFFYGMIGALCWVVGLYFIGFWRKTGDRFFALFAAAFWLLGVGRLAMSILGVTRETHVSVYVVRLFAYGIFLLAILDKNRGEAQRPEG